MIRQLTVLVLVPGRVILEIEKMLDREIPGRLKLTAGALFLQMLLEVLNGKDRLWQLAKIRLWEEASQEHINRQCHCHYSHTSQLAAKIKFFGKTDGEIYHLTVL